MNRKVTVTYDLPEEVCLVLEHQAATEGRRLEELVAEHVVHCQTRRREMVPQEIERRTAAFERHFGVWGSGDPNSSDNEKIDADLAREHDNRCY